MLSAVLAALVISVPSAGRKLPAVDRTYMIGAVEVGETNVVVAGRNVPVYRTGAWATTVDVVPGTNVVNVAGSNHWFIVAEKPPTPEKGATQVPPKKYEKLAYAKDAPVTQKVERVSSEIVVWLDPGHGGAALGALSPHGWCEKTANLRLAQDLRKAIERRGYRVMMTREDDRDIPLYDRPRAAHVQGADAFISIHYNAPAYDGDAAATRYFAVYAWNDLGSDLAAALAKGAESGLAEGLASKGALRANFAVTRSPEIPSCLVEADFLTHPAGEESAWSNAIRRRLAEALAQGFEDWLHQSHKADYVN